MTLVHGPLTRHSSASFPGKLGSALAVLVALCLALAAMFLPVVQSSDATTTGYTIEHNQQQLNDLQAQIHTTEAAIAQLGSMSRIQSQAAGLGMTAPTAQPVAVTVTIAPEDQLLIPRRFLPPPPPAAAPNDHSLLYSVLHALALR